MRARVLDALREYGEQPIDDLGRRVRVDYAPESDGERSREWLRGLLSDLVDDELVATEERADGVVAALRR